MVRAQQVKLGVIGAGGHGVQGRRRHLESDRRDPDSGSAS